MMEIVTKLQDVLGYEPDVSSYGVLMDEVFSALQEEYNNNAADKEAYLYQHYEPSDFLFGALEPERLRQRVAVWNMEIKREFLRCLDSVLYFQENGRMPTPEEIHTDTTKTYQLSCAVRELDNAWFDYAEHATCMDNGCGYNVMKVILADAQLADIDANPQNYAIVTVAVKS